MFNIGDAVVIQDHGEFDGETGVIRVLTVDGAYDVELDRDGSTWEFLDDELRLNENCDHSEYFRNRNRPNTAEQ